MRVKAGLSIALMVLLEGCAATPGPVAYQAIGNDDTTGSLQRVPQRQAAVATGGVSDSPVADDDNVVDKPRSTKLVAAPGGDIMIPTAAEHADSMRQLKMMNHDIQKPGLSLPTN